MRSLLAGSRYCAVCFCYYVMATAVQVSQRAVAKIIQVFDHLLQRNEKVARALRGEKEGTEESDIEVSTTHYCKVHCTE